MKPFEHATCHMSWDLDLGWIHGNPISCVCIQCILMSHLVQLYTATAQTGKTVGNGNCRFPSKWMFLTHMSSSGRLSSPVWSMCLLGLYIVLQTAFSPKSPNLPLPSPYIFFTFLWVLIYLIESIKYRSSSAGYRLSIERERGNTCIPLGCLCIELP